MSNPFTVTITPNRGWDERILVFQLDRLVTSFAVISDRYVVLLDTLINATTARTILDTIRPNLDTRQMLVINTHADWDHCWGNMLFAGSDESYTAPIIGHRLCRERMLSEAARVELAEMQQQSPGAFDGVRIEPPTITFDNHLLIDGGDLTFELIHTPGHQPDHISVFIPEIRAVFAGDATEATLPFGTLPQLRTSLERLQALHPEAVFACHAPGRYDPQLLADNLAYFNDLEQRTATALVAGTIPARIDATTDVEGLIGYPFADVPMLFALQPDEYEAYRDGHRLGIREMITYLRSRSANDNKRM